MNLNKVTQGKNQRGQQGRQKSAGKPAQQTGKGVLRAALI